MYRSVDVCGGRRFNHETLSILFKGKSIGETLAMSVEDAVEFFAAQRSVQHPLSCWQMSAWLLEPGATQSTLSARKPENQAGCGTREGAHRRAGIDTARRERQHTLYVLDEPTVGLHMADVEKLVKVLQRLVGRNSVVSSNTISTSWPKRTGSSTWARRAARRRPHRRASTPDAIARKPNKATLRSFCASSWQSAKWPEA